jgi:hypothetical protein
VLGYMKLASGPPLEYTCPHAYMLSPKSPARHQKYLSKT